MATGSDKSPPHGPCRQRLNTIAEHSGIAAAILASTDGNLLAAASDHPGIDIPQVAALSAMAAALNPGNGMPTYSASRSICISDLGGSPMIVLAVGPVLLTIIGRHGANMGMVSGIARDAGRSMDACLKSLGRKEPEDTGFIFDAEALTARVLAAIEERNGGFQEGSA